MKSARSSIPNLQVVGKVELPVNTNCLACSEDGEYLAVGHFMGLSVWSAPTLAHIASWERERLEITLIRMTKMAEMTYLIGTIDDMGVCRVFVYHPRGIFDLCNLNPMDDVNKRSNCETFDLHEGGDYGVAAISCAGDVFVEVYQFPTAAWLKELAQMEDLNPEEDLDIKWSSFTVMIKITPPKVTVRAVDGAIVLTQTKDFFSQWMALDVFKNRSNCFRDKSSLFMGSTTSIETVDVQKRCTHKLLLPCDQPDKNSTPVPDVVFPNAKEIICSATSRCTRYIALGLEDALVCVWDRRSGSQLSVTPIPTERSNLFRSGATYKVSTGYGTLPSVTQLTESSSNHRNLPTFSLSVSFLQGVSLVVHANGKMFLQDLIKQATVCLLPPPDSFEIACPNNPVYTINTEQQTLFIQGYQDERTAASYDESGQSQLLIFNFKESAIVKEYVVSETDALQYKYTQSDFYPDKNFESYLQQRLSLAEREKSIKQSWERLLETAKVQPPKHEFGAKKDAAES